MDDRPYALGIAIICGMPLLLVGFAFIRRNELVVSIVMPIMQLLSLFTVTPTPSNSEELSEKDTVGMGWAFLIIGILLVIVMVAYALFKGSS